MTIHVVEQPVFKAVQAILKAKFARPVSHRDTFPNTPARSELLRREVTLVGDLLIDALRLECEFGKSNLTTAEDEALSQWRTCRADVERLARDYASTVARWREAVQEEYN